MGFFGALGKILAGKPVYTPEDASGAGAVPPMQPDPANPDAYAAPPEVGATPAKTIPVVRLGRVECRASGQRVDIYVDMRNESAEPIFLDRILLLGTKRELDSQLRAGEGRQFVVYSGPLLTNPPSGYAEVQYRKQVDGDYFANYHQIRSQQEGDHGYVITEFRMQGPVKDI